MFVPLSTTRARRARSTRRRRPPPRGRVARAWRSGDDQRGDVRVRLLGSQAAVVAAEAHAEAAALAPPDGLARGGQDADVAEAVSQARAGRRGEQPLGD